MLNPESETLPVNGIPLTGKTQNRVFAIVLMIFCNSMCFAASEAGLVREGNQMYNKGKIDEALKNYNQALTAAPQEPLINFNIAAGLYKKGQYKEAIEAYQKALLSPKEKIEAGANYNIGNCKFRQGRLKEPSDVAAAIAEYKQALDCYKRAMELDPKDKDAKFNHEFVEKLIKSLMNKAAQQQKEKEPQAPEQKTEAQQKQGTQEAEAQQEQGQAPQQQKQQEKQQAQQGYEPGGETEPAERESGREMSKQEARMLLDDYRQREEQDRQPQDRQAAVRHSDVKKDW